MDQLFRVGGSLDVRDDLLLDFSLEEGTQFEAVGLSGGLGTFYSGVRKAA